MSNRGESRTDIANKPAAATDRTEAERSPESPLIAAAQLGRSVLVKGELTGSEDLTVDGRVEGVIDLGEHALTIGPNATITAKISARTVTIFGSVTGNVTVRETLHLRHGGSLEGDIVCGSMVIQDRAHFCGSVEMPDRRKAAADGELSRSSAA
jgi:cytoskeletal protein CcmA (bactofilin family)